MWKWSKRQNILFIPRKVFDPSQHFSVQKYFSSCKSLEREKRQTDKMTDSRAFFWLSSFPLLNYFLLILHSFSNIYVAFFFEHFIILYYSVFHQFEQAKFVNIVLILSPSHIFLLPQLRQKNQACVKSGQNRHKNNHLAT